MKRFTHSCDFHWVLDLTEIQLYKMSARVAVAIIIEFSNQNKFIFS